MEKSFPFNAVVTNGVPDRQYAAEDFAAERAAYVSNGVLADGALCVSVSAAGGLSVDIAEGPAVIDGYTYFNTASLSLSGAAADPSLPRVDLIALRLDLAGREMRCIRRAGTPATNPQMPAVQWDDTVREMPLASVAVAAGAVTLSADDITDLRVRADYILNRVEVGALLDEYRAALEDFFGEADAAALADAAAVVSREAGAGTVLCGDGVYRAANRHGMERIELFRLSTPGAFTFTTEAYPSADNLYDVILQGGGGSGSSYPGKMKGLGGDAGEYKAVTHVTLRDGVVYDGYVGAGGASAGAISFRYGNPGEDTRFFLFQAAGGQGGSTETPSSLLPSAGSLTGGGASLFAEGGISYQNGPAQGYGSGTDGAFGSGGGAGCAQTNDDTMTGGGGDGLVIVYGYRIAEDPA